jgi:hypothetical protein
VICPSCGSREVGYLPGHQYYCWSCFVQFLIGENRVEIYEVGEDGSLVLAEEADSEIGSLASGR